MARRGLDASAPHAERHGPPATQTLTRPDDEGLALAATADAVTSSALAPGDAIGPFVVERRLGRGGMGTVYLATDPKLDRPVAVKIHRRLSERDFVRFEREAKMLAGLQHPNIVVVHEVGAHAGGLYLAMEYVDGGTAREWLRQPRSSAEVLALMQQAGRGLAAAHAAGLVHRDFKPENVLVGRDGRVRVADFGIAGRLHPLTHESGDARGESTATSRGAGTRGYAAPEQLRGEDATAAADQFSFCVSLYEALYGVRPFTGDDDEALIASVEAGILAVPRRRVRVPGRVHLAVVRGLRFDAKARCPSMAALLREIEPRRMTPRMVALVGIGIAGVAALAGSLLRESAPTCLGAENSLGTAWSSARAAEVRRAFQQTGAEYAAPLADRLVSRLDGYAAQWVEQHTEACRATRVRGERSEALLDLQMACLAAGRRELDAVADALASVDVTSLPRADRLVARLEPVARCGELDRLLARSSDLPPVLLRGALDDLDAQLERARAEHALGRHAAAEALAREIVRRADELGLEGIAANATLAVAIAVHARGEVEPALELAYEAARRASQARQPRIAARAWARAVTWLGYDLDEPEAALALVHAAEAGIGDGEDGLSVRALLESSVASIHLKQRDFQAAQPHLVRSLELQRQAFGDEHDNVALIHNNLGILYRRAGRLDEARTHLQAALELRARLLGDQHPRLGAPHLNLANVLGALGEAGLAVEHARASVRIRRETHSEPHPDTFKSLSGLAAALSRGGRHDEALAVSEETLSEARAVYGELHPKVVQSLTRIAAAQADLGDHEGAVRRFDEAIGMSDAAGVADASFLLHARVDLAATLVLLGNKERARTELDAAMARASTALAPEDPTLARLRLEAAEAYETLLPPEQWRALALEAGRAAIDGESPRVRSGGHFLLARALTDDGPPGAEARDHVEQARRLLAEVKPPLVDAERAIDEWEARHP